MEFSHPFINTPQKIKIYTLLIFILLPVSSYSQNWTENIFFSLSGQYYIIPDIAKIAGVDFAGEKGGSAAFAPYPGFRAAAGYEWKKWFFSLETGFSYIKGNNPLVTDIYIIPLLLKAGYSFYPISFYDRFNLTPTLGFGMAFKSADHYKDAIDMLAGNKSSSSNQGLIIQAGVRAGWLPFVSLERKLELFAGLSLDCITETDGLIPLPQIEIGVIWRPFIKTKKAEAPVIVEEETTEEIICEEAEIEEEVCIEEEMEIEEEIAEIPEEIVEPVFKKQVRIIYFSPDVTVPTGNEINALKEVASAFGEYTEAKITIQGYAAPLRTSLGQKEISRRRAEYCAQYLTETCEIPKENIKTEWHGADTVPENIEKSDYPGRRIVVIAIEGWINQ